MQKQHLFAAGVCICKNALRHNADFKFNVVRPIDVIGRTKQLDPSVIERLEDLLTVEKSDVSIYKLYKPINALTRYFVPFSCVDCAFELVTCFILFIH